MEELEYPTYPPYPYEPLETAATIRVLVVEPAATFDEPLATSLVHMDRDEMLLNGDISSRSVTHFECVSYCWGEPMLSHALRCGDDTIQITKNVDSLLRRLRKKACQRPVWIDAICLNQADAQEKSVQIHLMGDIFRQAHKVHVWLGEESPEDRLRETFSFFKALSSRGSYSSIPGGTLDLASKIYQDGNALPIRRFLSRPWFQRRWVLQEAFLGHSVTARCGSLKIPWAWLSEGISALRTREDGFNLDQIHINAIAHVDSLYQGKAEYLNLLWRFHTAECSDHRDRIFALRGMATNVPCSLTPPLNLAVDCSLSWSEVFINFACSYVESFGPHTILQHVASFGSLAQVDPRWPSWVPNWTSTRYSHRFHLQSEWNFKAWVVKISGQGQARLILSGGSLYGPIHTVSPGGDESLEPYCADTTCSCKLQNSDPVLQFIKVIWGLGRETFYQHCLRIMIPAIMDAFFRIGCDNQRFGYSEAVRTSLGINPSLDELSKFETAYYEAITKLRDVILPEAWQLLSGPEAQMSNSVIGPNLAAVMGLLDDRKLFYVGENRLHIPGIGPPELESGDYVLRPPDIIPPEVALILRPTIRVGTASSCPKQFRLVGICFLDVRYQPLEEIEVIEEIYDRETKVTLM